LVRNWQDEIGALTILLLELCASLSWRMEARKQFTSGVVDLTGELDTLGTLKISSIFAPATFI